MTTAQIDVVEAKLNVDAYAQTTAEVAVEDTTMMHLHTCDTMYTVYAPGITLLSSPDPSNTTSSSVILIEALGNEAIEGNVLVYGSDSTHVAGGAEAYARVQTIGDEGAGTGLVTIDCGADGTMMLQSGLAKEPNGIMMSPEGIVVSSAELVTVLADENSLTIDPEAGIMLEVGESNVAVTEEAGISLTVGSTAIEITEEGITLTCGPNAVAITAEGITLSNGANTVEVSDEGIEINGEIVSVSGDEELSLDAPMITAG